MNDHDAQRDMVAASLGATHHPDVYARRLHPRGTAAPTPPAAAECAATGSTSPAGAAALLFPAAALNGTPTTTAGA